MVDIGTNTNTIGICIVTRFNSYSYSIGTKSPNIGIGIGSVIKVCIIGIDVHRNQYIGPIPFSEALQ